MKNSAHRNKRRGFVLVSAIAVVFILSTMSVLAIQNTGYNLYISAVQRDDALLDSMANTCLDIILERCRAADPDMNTGNCDSDPMSIMTLPRHDGTETLTVYDNPVIGHSIGFPNCVEGGVSPHCVCRTGYLYDYDGNFFKLDMSNSRHIGKFTTPFPTFDDGSSSLTAIIRNGSEVGHILSYPVSTDTGTTFKRQSVWLSVAVNNSAREYNFILETADSNTDGTRYK